MAAYTMTDKETEGAPAYNRSLGCDLRKPDPHDWFLLVAHPKDVTTPVASAVGE